MEFNLPIEKRGIPNLEAILKGDPGEQDKLIRWN